MKTKKMAGVAIVSHTGKGEDLRISLVCGRYYPKDGKIFD